MFKLGENVIVINWWNGSVLAFVCELKQGETLPFHLFNVYLFLFSFFLFDDLSNLATSIDMFQLGIQQEGASNRDEQNVQFDS